MNISKKNRLYKNILLIIILILVLIGVSIFSMTVGAANISVSNIFDIIFYKHDSWQYAVLMKLRVPRIVMGFAVGGSLALAGALLQGIFRNPLVEPYTLGISGGASLGVCIVIVFHLTSIIGLLSYPLFGFIGAILTMIIIYTVGARKSSMKINNLLLTGVMVSFICSSAVMLIMSLSQARELQSIVFWTMGSLDETNTDLIYMIVTASVISLVLSYFFCIDLNGFAIGEEEAAHIGINTERTKKWVFILASVLTGLSVSVAGIIGFVGLVVPHIIRIFTGPDHRILLIASFLSGAIFLIACDTIARTIISPLELPVGVITGIIGGIIFIYAINKKKVSL